LEFYFLTEELAKVLNVPQKAGLLIQRVAENSPGHDLGFRPGTIPVKIGNQELLIGGDIVLEVQGIPISGDMKAMRKIREMVQERRGLTGLEFKVLRDGKIMKLLKSN
jgi:S1-C subfamily serine protease